MANTRYFQHLNPQDELFQKITTLSEIDDIDPNFVLYYFNDGTKCNVDYIAPLNAKDVYGKYEFAEVSGPNNGWIFEIQEVKREKRYATNANGERVEVVDIMDRCDNPHQDGKRVNVKRAPEFVDPRILSSVEDKSAKTKEEKKLFNFNSAVKSEPEETQAKVETIEETSTNSCKPKVGLYDEVTYTDRDGNTVTKCIKDLIELANKEPQVVEKIIEKKVLADDIEVIDIALDDTQKALIENMIDMSQKETCDIDMEITLSLPPVTVYQLIKNVYPKGMSEAFVNIIANRMNIKELKSKVAQGLLAYYDADANVDVVNENK